MKMQRQPPTSSGMTPPTEQPRVPAGVPSGGRFTERRQSDSNASLNPAQLITSEEIGRLIVGFEDDELSATAVPDGAGGWLVEIESATLDVAVSGVVHSRDDFDDLADQASDAWDLEHERFRQRLAVEATDEVQIAADWLYGAIESGRSAGLEEGLVGALLDPRTSEATFKRIVTEWPPERVAAVDAWLDLVYSRQPAGALDDIDDGDGWFTSGSTAFSVRRYSTRTGEYGSLVVRQPARPAPVSAMERPPPPTPEA
jgi:hypothetical protein